MTSSGVMQKNRFDALMGELALRLATVGFIPMRRDQAFRRGRPDGADIVHLSFVRHPTSFDTTMDVAVRIDAIEEIVGASNAVLSASARKKTATVGVEIGNLSQGSHLAWNIDELTAIDRVALDIFLHVARFGLPFFARFGDIATVTTMLCRDDPEAMRYSPFHHVRASRAVAGLLALGMTGEAREIAGQKVAFMRELQDPNLEFFLTFLRDVSLPVAE